MRNDIPIDYVLNKLNEAFTVSDISNALVTAKDAKEAEEIHSNMDFDRIPITSGGDIGTFYDFNAGSQVEITLGDAISESSGLLETLIYLSQKDFYFILSGNKISGIVHYSDLNNPLVSIGIYAQIAYCEDAIRNFARSKDTLKVDHGEKFIDGINSRCGNAIDLKRASSQFKKKKESQTETDLFDELYFDDELILFREIIKSSLDAEKVNDFIEFIDLGNCRIKSFSNLRNQVMHSKPEIIKERSDINKWLGFLHTCQSIMKVIDGNTAFNQSTKNPFPNH